MLRVLNFVHRNLRRNEPNATQDIGSASSLHTGRGYNPVSKVYITMNNSQIKTASCFLCVYLIQNIAQVPSNLFVLTFQDTLHDKPIRSCHHAATDNVVACHHQRRRRPQPLGRATVGLTEVGHTAAGNISDHVHLGSPESAMSLPTMSLARLNHFSMLSLGSSEPVMPPPAMTTRARAHCH